MLRDLLSVVRGRRGLGLRVTVWEPKMQPRGGVVQVTFAGSGAV